MIAITQLSTLQHEVSPTKSSLAHTSLNKGFTVLQKSQLQIFYRSWSIATTRE